MMEFTVNTSKKISNPFWDVRVNAIFTLQDGSLEQKVIGFYDGINEKGEHAWKVRWISSDSGEWNCRIFSEPAIEELACSFNFSVEADSSSRNQGFLRAKSGQAWGLTFDNGEPFFLLGDTIYNLFGGKYCGVDIEKIIGHRKAQGVNYIRARMQVSPYHPQVTNVWQTKDCWPWKGSAQWPDFSGFNLSYFQAVVEVMQFMTDLGMDMELIFEAWIMEFPFNDRSKFLPEYEEHWIRYIVSRYSAYPCVYIWCPANEYDLYPRGSYSKESDRWLKRVAAFIKSIDPFSHPIGAHQWHQATPLHERIGDCKDIDIYLVQSDWYKEIDAFDRDPSLCLWIDEQVRFHSPNQDKVVICSEFGYERAEGCFTVDASERIDQHHTRRGQWKAGFAGYPVVHGFNNTWGPHLTVEIDAVGTQYLLPFYKFMTEELTFTAMSPRPEWILMNEDEPPSEGNPQCLGNGDKSVIAAVYFPTAGACSLNLGTVDTYDCYWFNPRTGLKSEKWRSLNLDFSTPWNVKGEDILESDWVLCLRLSAN